MDKTLEKDYENELTLIKNKYSHKITKMKQEIISDLDKILLSWAIKSNKYYLGHYTDQRYTWIEKYDKDNMVIKVKLICISELTHTPYNSGRDGIYEFIVNKDEINNYVNHHIDNNIEPDNDINKLRYLA